MVVQAAAGDDGVQRALEAVAAHVPAVLTVIGPGVVLALVAMLPLPGRGSRSRRRDPWRGFRFGPRCTVLQLAGHRCEAPAFLAWGRCSRAADEVDHVYPWSKGGATVVSNGQALCNDHNRRKAALIPPWWYVLGLERRRRRYYPAEASVRVSAAMSAADRTARSRSPESGPRPSRRRHLRGSRPTGRTATRR